MKEKYYVVVKTITRWNLNNPFETEMNILKKEQ